MMSLKIGAVVAATAMLGRQALRTGRRLADMAGEAERVGRRYEVLFRGLTAGTNRWIDAQMAALGRNRSEWQAWLSTIQDTLVPMGFARDQAAEMSQELTQLAVDAAAFVGVQPEKALRDFQMGLVGTGRAIRQYGVVISQARIEEEMQRKGMEQSYAQLSEQERLLMRYNIILSDLTDAQGAATRQGESWLQVTGRLRSAWTGFQEEVGTLITSSDQLRGTLEGVSRALAEITREMEVNRLVHETLTGETETYEDTATRTFRSVMTALRGVQTAVRTGTDLVWGLGHATAYWGHLFALDLRRANQSIALMEKRWRSAGKEWNRSAARRQDLMQTERELIRRLSEAMGDLSKEERIRIWGSICGIEDINKRLLAYEAKIEDLQHAEEARAREAIEQERKIAEAAEEAARRREQAAREAFRRITDTMQNVYNIWRDQQRDLRREYARTQDEIARLEAESGRERISFAERMTRKRRQLREREADEHRQAAERLMRELEELEDAGDFPGREEHERQIVAEMLRREAAAKRLARESEQETENLVRQLGALARAAREAGDYEEAMRLARRVMDYAESEDQLERMRQAHQFILDTQRRQREELRSEQEERREGMIELQQGFEHLRDVLDSLEIDIDWQTAREEAEEFARYLRELFQNLPIGALGGRGGGGGAPFVPSLYRGQETGPLPAAGGAIERAQVDIHLHGAGVDKAVIRDEIMPEIKRAMRRMIEANR